MIKFAPGLFLGTLCLLTTYSAASTTSIWQVDSYKSFNEGEAKGSIITSLGEVRPGWSTEDRELPFDNPWSSLRTDDGTIYIGSDDGATIYRDHKGKVESFATVGEKAIAVVSLAKIDNTLYAGTMPDGEVWSIDLSSKKTKKIVTLKDTETVWSLAAANEALYAGTGPEGLLYKISPKSGKTELVFDTEDKRIMSMLHTGDDALWFGTSDRALLFRHDIKSKKTRSIADFSGNEVSALAEDNGTLIVAANDLTPKTTSGFKTKEAVEKAKKETSPGQEAKMPKAGTVPGADKPSSANIEPLAKSLRKGKGALYRVRGDGHLTQLHALTASYFTSIAVAPDGKIFAGDADQGRIYLVGANEAVSTAFDVDERYVAQIMVTDEGSLIFTTGDAARIFSSTGSAKQAHYFSEAFDAKVPSRFGRFAWHGKGSFSIQTRTGNTAEPGTGWSSWQSLKSPLKGVGTQMRATVASPTARYFQYRVSFAGDESATLSRTKLFYLPSNRESRIVSAEVTPKGKTSILASNAPKGRSPIIELKWKVDNDDKDATVYTLEVRRDGESVWRKLPTGSSPLTKTEFDWNTETYPDGYYRVRITASDRLANTRERALVHRKTTPLFAVDNEHPKLAGVSVRYPQVSARATDALSTIDDVAFSIDDGPWFLGAPRDGIFDDQSEFLSFELPEGIAKGEHMLTIRVADAAGNIGSTSSPFTVR